MMETDDIQELATYIRDKGYSRIGIDGTDGVGKSTLARSLSEMLGSRPLNLDDYLIQEQGGFLDHLKYNEIKQKMLELECFVVDGVCMLIVLEKIEMRVDCMIYVKRMCHGIWADERECEITENIEEFIKKEREPIQSIEESEATPKSLGLAEEIIRYHEKYKPHQKAELFYIRDDS